MATDNEASCVTDPNFAVICSFLERFGKSCGVEHPDIARLQEMIENSQEVSQELIDLHVKLLRKVRKSVAPEKWEKAIVKFCHSYSNQDGWELERIGYKKSRVAVKLRLLKALLEAQFDANQKFKNEINKQPANELRLEPLGRDKAGLVYWCQVDEEANIRVYREDLDEENWELVAKTRDEVVSLINTLTDGETGAIPISEDSNSLETSEKPTIDTGQELIDTLNGDVMDKTEDKQIKNVTSENDDEQEDEEEEEDEEDEEVGAEEEEEEEEEEEDEEEEEEEEEEEDEEEDEEEEENEQMNSKENGKVSDSVNLPAQELRAKETRNEVIQPIERQSAIVETLPKREETLSDLKNLEGVKNGATIDSVLSVPKSIETPVIKTSPLKLVNIADLKQSPEKKPEISGKVPVINNLPFTTSIEPSSAVHNKLPIKPIDQLAANLVRMQTEKMEKPLSKLDKIAENLAKGANLQNAMSTNGEEDMRLHHQQAKSHRGMDLSTSPRGWESGASDLSASSANRPVDFSGMDLSSRKLSKPPADLPSPGGYRSQEFLLQQQQREMDLSTRKSTSKLHPNMQSAYDPAFDARAAMLRNHAMVADLSKRQQLPYGAYDLPQTTALPLHSSRLPKEIDPSHQQRLPGYAMLPDPSKLAALRMAGAPMKRPMENESLQAAEAMLKRVRPDIMPIRSNLDPSKQRHWREEVGEAIEEPVMMVHGQGSGSDCDAVNPLIFSEAIEEPVMHVYGQGSGAECDTGNPVIVEEAIEEPVMYFYGEGSGAQCETGNTNDETSTTEKKEEESCKEGVESSTSELKTPPKPKFTLGVQVFSGSSTPMKRASRWDVGAPGEKSDISAKDNEEKNSSPPKFFFGPNCVSYTATKAKEAGMTLQQELKVAESKDEDSNGPSTATASTTEEEKETSEIREKMVPMHVRDESKPSEVSETETMECDTSAEPSELAKTEAADGVAESSTLPETTKTKETESKVEEVTQPGEPSESEASEELANKALLDLQSYGETEGDSSSNAEQLSVEVQKEKEEESCDKVLEELEQLISSSEDTVEKPEESVTDRPTTPKKSDETGEVHSTFPEEPASSTETNQRLEETKMEVEATDDVDTPRVCDEGLTLEPLEAADNSSKVESLAESTNLDKPVADLEMTVPAMDATENEPIEGPKHRELSQEKDDVELELSKMEEDESKEAEDSKAAPSSTNEGADKLHSKSLINDTSSKPQLISDDESSNLFDNDDFKSKAEADSISNILLTLERSKSESANEKEATDFLSTQEAELTQSTKAKETTEELLSTLEGDGTEPSKEENTTDDLPVTFEKNEDKLTEETEKEKESESLKEKETPEESNILSTLEDSNTESESKVDKSFVPMESDISTTLEKSIEITETEQKMEDSLLNEELVEQKDTEQKFPKKNFNESFANINSSRFSSFSALDDTVKMEETFSAENTSRLRMSTGFFTPEKSKDTTSTESKMDESLSSHEISDFQEPAGFSRAFDNTTESRDKSEEFPSSSALTEENLAIKADAERVGEKKTEEDKSEVSSLIVECASSVPEDDDSLPTDLITEPESPSDIAMEDDEKFDEFIDEPPPPDVVTSDEIENVTASENCVEEDKLLDERSKIHEDTSKSVTIESKDAKVDEISSNEEMKMVAKLEEKCDSVSGENLEKQEIEESEKVGTGAEAEKNKNETKVQSSFMSLVANYDSDSNDLDDLSNEKNIMEDDAAEAEKSKDLELAGEIPEKPEIPAIPTIPEIEKNDASEKSENKDPAEENSLMDDQKSSQSSEKVHVSSIQSTSEKLNECDSVKDQSENELLNHESKVVEDTKVKENNLEASVEQTHSSEKQENIEKKVQSYNEEQEDITKQQEKKNSVLEGKFDSSFDENIPFTHKKRKEVLNDLNALIEKKQHMNEFFSKNENVTAYQMEAPNNSMVLENKFESYKYDRFNESNRMKEELLSKAEKYSADISVHSGNCRNENEEFKKDSAKRLPEEEIEDLPPTEIKPSEIVDIPEESTSDVSKESSMETEELQRQEQSHSEKSEIQKEDDEPKSESIITQPVSELTSQEKEADQMESPQDQEKAAEKASVSESQKLPTDEHVDKVPIPDSEEASKVSEELSTGENQVPAPIEPAAAIEKESEATPEEVNEEESTVDELVKAVEETSAEKDAKETIGDQTESLEKESEELTEKTDESVAERKEPHEENQDDRMEAPLNLSEERKEPLEEPIAPETSLAVATASESTEEKLAKPQEETMGTEKVVEPQKIDEHILTLKDVPIEKDVVQAEKQHLEQMEVPKEKQAEKDVPEKQEKIVEEKPVEKEVIPEQMQVAVEKPVEKDIAPEAEKQLKEKSEAEKNKKSEKEEEQEPEAILEHKVDEEISDDDSMGNDESMFDAPPMDEVDPLADSEPETSTPAVGSIRVKAASELGASSGWKVDSPAPAEASKSPKTEPPPPPQRVTRQTRKRRNSAQESNSEDVSLTRVTTDEEDAAGGKRIKLKGKRSADVELRKSVEKSRQISVSSEDDGKKEAVAETVDNGSQEETSEKTTEENLARSLSASKRGRPRGGRRRRGGFRGRPAARKIEMPAGDTATEAAGETTETNDEPAEKLDKAEPPTETEPEVKDTAPKESKKVRRKKNRLLGLDIPADVVANIDNDPPVRTSRRIAQLRIRKEADKSREDDVQVEIDIKKHKKEKGGKHRDKSQDTASSDKKKRKRRKQESEDDAEMMKQLEKEAKAEKKRQRRKKKKLAAKFDEANPWKSSSGSSTSDEGHEEEEEELIESDGEELVFKSDHEFSPESDLEKDSEAEPTRRARTAQKPKSDDEEAIEDEYACQKCSKSDHPEWILLCDTCDKGWHCSCLRPALMLIPEGDWFCPPCQHKTLVTKLTESLKSFDVLTKKRENEIMRKKRLAYVGISLDNVLQKNERSQRDSRGSSEDEDGSSEGSSSGSSSGDSSSDESEPVYQLRERRCANTYKFNEYDDMINAAIKDEVDAVKGAGNQGRGKDISTIVNAEKEERAQSEALKHLKDDDDDEEQKSEKESDEDFKLDKEEDSEAEKDEEEDDGRGARAAQRQKLLARKKHRKLNSLDISSEEDDPYSDEDFKGSSSDEEEDPDEQISSDDSEFSGRRRGRKDHRPVRRSTRARTTRYDEDFINDNSDDSDRPKKKKSRSAWAADSESEESDNSWRQKKKSRRRSSVTRKPVAKVKSSKKKKRKRIIANDSDDEEDQPQQQYDENLEEPVPSGEPQEAAEESQLLNPSASVSQDAEMPVDESAPMDEEGKPLHDAETALETSVPPAYAPVPVQEDERKKKKEPKQKKIRRKVIYGRIPDENEMEQEDSTLGRRTRGRKISYLDAMPSDSDEELKKALRKTEETEEEFVVNENEAMNDDAEKDSDSGDVYSPKYQSSLRAKNKSPKMRKGKKSPGAKRKSISDDGTPKVRKKPGPKPGTKKKSPIKAGDDFSGLDPNIINDADVLSSMHVDDPAQEIPGSVTGEGSLASLGQAELEGLDDEQIDQMMMEDEEYGRRQLELAAIEIAKKKKKEEREAKKLEKARQKALEILAAESQGGGEFEGDGPKKKKRGRRSKAEILAEQMRRESMGQAPEMVPTQLGAGPSPQLQVPPSPQPQLMPQAPPQLQIPPQIPSQALVSPNPEVVAAPVAIPNMPPNLIPGMEPGCDPRMMENPMMSMMGAPPQMMEQPMFSPDGSPMKPKRRGRGKGKKTLAMEAARAAEAAAKTGILGMPPGGETNPDLAKLEEMQAGVMPPTGPSTPSPSPSTPPAGMNQGAIPPPSQPPNPQPVYPNLPPQQQSSVITRMLQSQPVGTGPQSFTAAAAAMGHKYFGGPNAPGQMMPVPRPGYDIQNRGRIPSPYRQPGPQPLPPHFAAMRAGTPPGMRLRVPGPQMYHTPHHPMDPSPSGGGPIAIGSRGDRNSPLAPGGPQGPQMIPPSAGSPLAKGGPTPPPPYVRGVGRYGDSQMSPRHPLPPFTNASPGVVNHMQQPSPPTSNRPGNFSPYHPPPPPNYHYGAYPPPPPMSTADDAAAYQSSPYSTSAEQHFSSPGPDGQSNIQAPPQQQPQPPPQQQPQPPPASQPAPQQPGHGPPPQQHPGHSSHPHAEGHPPPPQGHPPQGHPHHPGGKYDEEGSGEFGGLVSYFSSQREDDLES